MPKQTNVVKTPVVIKPKAAPASGDDGAEKARFKAWLAARNDEEKTTTTWTNLRLLMAIALFGNVIVMTATKPDAAGASNLCRILQSLCLWLSVLEWSYNTPHDEAKLYSKYFALAFFFFFVGDVFVMGIVRSIMDPITMQIVFGSYCAGQLALIAGLRCYGGRPNLFLCAVFGGFSTVGGLAHQFFYPLQLHVLYALVAYSSITGVTMCHTLTRILRSPRPPGSWLALIGILTQAVMHALLPFAVYGRSAGYNVTMWAMFVFEGYVFAQYALAYSVWNMIRTHRFTPLVGEYVSLATLEKRAAEAKAATTEGKKAEKKDASTEITASQVKPAAEKPTEANAR